MRLKALGCAIVGTALPFVLAAAITRSPMSQDAKESLLAVVLWLPLLFSHALAWFINYFGPPGMPEAPANYLGPDDVRNGVLLSILVFGTVLYVAALAVLSWRVRRRGQSEARRA
jgi:hypothetical protein